MRKDWDTYFMDIAYMAATRSRCPRRQVGTVLVNQRKLLGTAYNGAPMGVDDCSEVGCMISIEFQPDGSNEGNVMIRKERCVRTIHAEQNLLLFTDRRDRDNAVIYVTDQPCWTCANMIANSGIKEIVYHRPYPKDQVKVSELMQRCNILFRQLDAYIAPPGLSGEVTN